MSGISREAYQAASSTNNPWPSDVPVTDGVPAMASQNAVAAPARMLRAVSPRAMRRWRRDGQLVVTLGLLAPITIIALGRETHAEALVAAAIAAVGLQLVLGAVERRASAGMRPVVEVLRTATTVALLGAAQLITGASGLLAIGYVPIVATATGRSLRRLGIVVGMSIAMHMLVEAYARADSGSPLDLSLRDSPSVCSSSSALP